MGDVWASSDRPHWVYVYLFAKNDRDNIGSDELEDFRTLAKSYAMLSEQQMARLLKDNDLIGIHNGDED